MVEDFSTPVTPSTPPAPPFTQIWFLTRLFNPVQWVASPLPPPPSSPILVSIPSQVGVRSVSVVSLQRRASLSVFNLYTVVEAPSGVKTRCSLNLPFPPLFPILSRLSLFSKLFVSKSLALCSENVSACSHLYSRNSQLHLSITWLPLLSVYYCIWEAF